MPMYTTWVMPPARLEHPRGADHLPDDLARAQVALEPHRAREAEGAREAAADLGGHAEREPVAVGHQHRLHARPVGQAKTSFSLPSCDGVRRSTSGTPTNARSDSVRPEVARQIGHGVDVDGTLACRSTSRSGVRDTGALRVTRRVPRARTARDRTSSRRTYAAQDSTGVIHRLCGQPVDKPVGQQARVKHFNHKARTPSGCAAT